MFKVLGENYYLDMDELDNYVQMPRPSSGANENHINIVKYEIVKLMVEIVMDEHDEIDEKIGAKDASIPFKLAFNTLLNKKIIQSY